jgi:hypothetical protein
MRKRALHPEVGRQRAWTLFVAVCLLCIGFWATADLFHEEEGIESDPDCPICQLERVAGSGAPTESPVVLAPEAPLVQDVVAWSVPVVTVEETFGPSDPRGPPIAS